MTNYKDSIIEVSLNDVTDILEHSPVQHDLVPEIVIARMMNRGPIAHLAIERALKFLLEKANGTWQRHHDLHKHLEALRKSDAASVEYLEQVFDEAIQHYRINPNEPDNNHFKNLADYLSVTGSEQAFNKMRYWELGQSLDDKTLRLVRSLSLQIHYEILQGLGETVVSTRQPYKTINHRVSWALRDAINPSTGQMAYTIGSDKQKSVEAYISWVLGYETIGDAIADAYQKEFQIGDAFANAVARQAFEKLVNATDPAIKYLARVLSVLPMQQRDIVPCVEWLGLNPCVFGRVHTPGGAILGHIERGPDGIWNVNSSGGRSRRVSAKTNSPTDARCYLAAQLTTSAHLTTNDQETALRVVDIECPFWRRASSFSPADDKPGRQHRRNRVTVTFWDDGHGLIPGQEAQIVRLMGEHFEEVVEGTVTDVSGAEVQIAGHVSYKAA